VGDVYQPYTNRPYNYEHEIGQGLKNNFFRNQFYVSYNYNFMYHFFLEANLRYDTAFNWFSFLPLIGCRVNLWNDYRNY
jgi:hypothetical protein